MRFSFLTALGVVLLVLAGCRPAVERVEWPVMGTIAAVETHGKADPAQVRAVRETFAEVERLLNAHDPASELSRLAPLADDEVLARCSPLVRPCYEAAFRLQRETGGAFSPRWRGPRTLDLGAIAKGFAVDLAAEKVKGADLLVDIGGNLKAAGGEWRVGIARSDRRFTLAAGEACATSADYYRGDHIFDARTGRPAASVASVTVRAPSAQLADALSTVVFILGPQAGSAFVERSYPEATVLLVAAKEGL